MGVAWVTWPNYEILGPPYNFGTNRDICFKFGTDIDDGHLLRLDLKMTPNWAWPGSRDQIFEILGPPYNFGTNRDICFNFGTGTDDGPLLRPDTKPPLSGRGLGRVTRFRNFGIPL